MCRARRDRASVAGAGLGPKRACWPGKGLGAGSASVGDGAGLGLWAGFGSGLRGLRAGWRRPLESIMVGDVSESDTSGRSLEMVS